MRRVPVLLAVVAAAFAVVPAQATVSGGASTASYFVTRSGPEVVPGYQHVYGVGVTGRWQGWSLGMDYVLSTDCYNTCPIELLRWELSSGNRKVWGTCSGDGYGYCIGAGIQPVTSRVTVPLTITGGTTWMDSGTGDIGGYLPMAPALPPAEGVVTVSLSPA